MHDHSDTKLDCIKEMDTDQDGAISFGARLGQGRLLYVAASGTLTMIPTKISFLNVYASMRAHMRGSIPHLRSPVLAFPSDPHRERALSIAWAIPAEVQA